MLRSTMPLSAPTGFAGRAAGLLAAAIAGLARVRLAWNRRRRLVRMRDLDDRTLDDIGITRDELEWALGLPFEANAALDLQRRASLRRTLRVR